MRHLLPIALCLTVVACSGTEPQKSATPSSSAAPLAKARDPEAGAVAGKPTSSNPTPKTPSSGDSMPAYNPLTTFEASVIRDKGTERAFTGEYTDSSADGTYICRQCNTPLYRSKDKFHSGCGWPSFDDEIPGAVERHDDSSHGMVRTEIVCKNCKGHLGHVFEGERMTAKNTRHCVNSVSMRFVPEGQDLPKPIVLRR